MVDLREFLARPAEAVAPELLGWRLSHGTSAGRVTVQLTEVEAYHGEQDPASHAARGRTARNSVMFGPAGHVYVYFSYGMHWCANVVCGTTGTASAVLLRAGRVVEGVELARARRPPLTRDAALARGPACLTQALGIERRHDGTDLVRDRYLRLAPPVDGLVAEQAADISVSSGPRVGVSQAADVPWRFWVTGDPTVSPYKRSPRAPALP